MIHITYGRKDRASTKAYLTEIIEQRWEVRRVYVSVGEYVEDHDSTHGFRRFLPSRSSLVDPTVHNPLTCTP